MKKINYSLIFKFAAVVGLLIFLHYSRILRPAENVFIKIMKPFAGSLHSFGEELNNIYYKQFDRRDLLNAAKIAEEKAKQLEKENASLKYLEEENIILREYLQFFNKNKYKYILANVLSDLKSDTYLKKEIIIDKGKNDGLYEGLAVLDSSGILIGKITEIKDTISKVSISTNADCRLAATIKQPKTMGVTEGELGLIIKLNFIPQSEVIKVKDIVMTSGLEKNIPPGLIIGEISQVESKKNEVWQTATIEPLADFNELKIVSIIIPEL